MNINLHVMTTAAFVWSLKHKTQENWKYVWPIHRQKTSWSKIFNFITIERSTHDQPNNAGYIRTNHLVKTFVSIIFLVVVLTSVGLSELISYIFREWVCSKYHIIVVPRVTRGYGICTLSAVYKGKAHDMAETLLVVRDGNGNSSPTFLFSVLGHPRIPRVSKNMDASCRRKSNNGKRTRKQTRPIRSSGARAKHCAQLDTCRRKYPG